MRSLQPLVRLALYLTLLASASTLVTRRAAKASSLPGPAPSTVVAVADAPCPRGTLPDNGVCIPVPGDSDDEGDPLLAERNVHRTKRGDITEYEQIPRRPDRPRDYRLYRYPVEPLPGQSLLMSGYDLDQPDQYQRRGGKLKAVGHGGIDLAAHRNAEIHLVSLERQTAPTEVLYVGWLFGNTVVTLHPITEAGESRAYLVIYGHLERAAQGLQMGDIIDDGALIGYVGDSDSPGAIHLHLEIRQVRTGLDARALKPGELVDNARTVACDPRNLLQLLPPQ